MGALCACYVQGATEFHVWASQSNEACFLKMRYELRPNPGLCIFFIYLVFAQLVDVLNAHLEAIEQRVEEPASALLCPVARLEDLHLGGGGRLDEGAGSISARMRSLASLSCCCIALDPPLSGCAERLKRLCARLIVASSAYSDTPPSRARASSKARSMVAPESVGFVYTCVKVGFTHV